MAVVVKVPRMDLRPHRRGRGRAWCGSETVSSWWRRKAGGASGGGVEGEWQRCGEEVERLRGIDGAGGGEADGEQGRCGGRRRRTEEEKKEGATSSGVGGGLGMSGCGWMTA
jgi:hypothetical protein